MSGFRGARHCFPSGLAADDTGNPAGSPGWVWVATADEQAGGPGRADPAVLAQQAYGPMAML
ncbi:hypothetical protein E0504_49415 [Parafrankia sp. BMG5.11]|uniref:hypothetical protein n=1 Tax=Parafrankia sp. Ea1.12 TaxID=573499 RepID=UPI000DA56E6B|nr:hypothetical protein [Parafrankia sp. Ea1.12]TCJ30995.1 hypothetical protein E0504_49415 [Parafrankia sp. BMG5.11]SQD99556.1 hypothetical protein FMEAI12_5420002 [Parafrankia sp. Ea1.12]